MAVESQLRCAAVLSVCSYLVAQHGMLRIVHGPDVCVGECSTSSVYYCRPAAAAVMWTCAAADVL
jgi:hypothetical protein